MYASFVVMPTLILFLASSTFISSRTGKNVHDFCAMNLMHRCCSLLHWKAEAIRLSNVSSGVEGLHSMSSFSNCFLEGKVGALLPVNS